MPKPPLTLVLAAPRGFCAGVDRAIKIVELALERYGPPVYVRHEIVHNRYVVADLRAKGAVFVEQLDEVPDHVLGAAAGAAPRRATVIFSAHGAPKSVAAEARRRRLSFVDATCPLVSKVHREAERLDAEGRLVLLIGHAGHPEVIGTMGQAREGAVVLVETVADAEALQVANPKRLAYVTQTTLSVDDTRAIVEVLRRRFPAIAAPRRDDICYATTNRQQAVKAIAARCDALAVVGAPNSSNSQRLVEVARRAGCALAFLVERGADMPFERLRGVRRLGVSAGASAPEALVDEVIAACRARYEVCVDEVTTTREDVTFQAPRALRA